ncbi:MAG TPA: phosphodiester glycosidase family protein [Candidatus Wallbacteria bacterium]|nr:phosphodiester glycosidase family protein [Candidatus Wallbacteria bacterium]
MKYIKLKILKPDCRQSIHVLELDINSNKFKLESVFGKDSLHNKETVSSMAKRKNAVAAVNGSFFSNGGNPLGMIIHQGKIIKEPILGRTVMGITSSNEIFFDNPKFDARFYYKNEISETGECHFIELDGINRPPVADEVIIYTPEYGNRTMTKNNNSFEIVVSNEKVISMGRANSVIPPDGYVIYACGVMYTDLERVCLNDEASLELYINPIWEKTQFAVGGGPRLLRDGSVINCAADEKFRPDVAKGRAPRTAIGMTSTGKLLLVCVDGRQPKTSAGMNLKELSALMVKLGAVDAMNLDGGGSTTLYLMGKVMNSPSDGCERPVSQALILKACDGEDQAGKKVAFESSEKNIKF